MKYIFGMHDPGAEHLFQKKGWIVFTEGIGHNPSDMGGRDYSRWSNDEFGVIARLNNSYYPGGTIPERAYYTDFAERCENFVHSSSGCRRWVIGNEPNHEQERPHGQLITPYDYANCFALCRTRIKELSGHENDEVIVAPSAPWNATTVYPGNSTGDWVQYYTDCLREAYVLGQPTDAICLHTYTHGPDAHAVSDDVMMPAPYSSRHWNFRAYRDYLNALPDDVYIDLPTYITETDQEAAWSNVPNTWVREAYREIDNWNQTSPRKIHCLCLYRWPKYDQWFIDGKGEVIKDFQGAMENEYLVGEEPIPPIPPIPPDPEEGDMETIIFDGFEDGFYDYQGIGELTVPKEWTPKWRPDWARPEFDAKDKNKGQPEVRTGRYAATIFLPWKRFDGFLVRKFNTGSNRRVRASVWAMSVSRNNTGGYGGHGSQIGIDPTGGDDPAAMGVWWSGWTERKNDIWQYIETPLVTSESQYITVFIRSLVDWDSNFSGGHYDDFTLLGEQYTPPPGSDWTEEQIRAMGREEALKVWEEVCGYVSGLRGT